MRNYMRLLILLSVLLISFSAYAQTNVMDVLADPARPEEDRARDAGRKPDQVLEFFGIGAGDRVADLLAGGGYYTRILVPVVGPDGAVYAGNNPFFQRFVQEAMDALLSEVAFENVMRIDGPVDELALPMDGSLDAVIMVLAYHDRSDGGLIITLCEMAFAGHMGLNVNLDALGTDPIAALFAEELGAVLQVRRRHRERLLERFAGSP